MPDVVNIPGILPCQGDLTPKGGTLSLDTHQFLNTQAILLIGTSGGDINGANKGAVIIPVTPVIDGNIPQQTDPGLHTQGQLFVLGSDGYYHLLKTPAANEGAQPVGGVSEAAISNQELMHCGNLGQDKCYNRLGFMTDRIVSAPNTVASAIYDIKNLHDIGYLFMFTSAGTATLKIELSNDGTNYDWNSTVAAAASIYYDFNGTDANMKKMMAFRYIKITIGAAGVGNTTTTILGFK